MKIHQNLDKLPPFRKAVLTIGSFDGVHIGHRKIIKQVQRLATECGGESVLLTFHPHPRSILKQTDGSVAPKLLNTLEEKTTILENLGIDHLVVIPFTPEFSEQTPESYITNFLVGKFHPQHIVIGYDHRFGKDRLGDIVLLQKLAPTLGYVVTEIPKHTIDDIAISSTKIRHAIGQGEMEAAAQLLGAPFGLHGKVVQGQRLGRELGFPTANLYIDEQEKIVPPDGIYAVTVSIEKQTHIYGGMLYIGLRPSIENAEGRVFEVNILDFKEDIYGKNIAVHLLKRLRPDQQFPTLDALKTQLHKDEAQTRTVLKKNLHSTAEPQPKVAIVVLNYNTQALLKQLLPAVLATNYANLEIWVADNHSTDGSLQMVEQHFKTVRTLALPSNLGFAKGYNDALKHIHADYFALLNSDVEVTENWLTPLVDAMEADKEIAACQPKIKNYNNKSFFEYAGAAGGMIDFLGYPFCRGRIFDHVERDNQQYDEPQPVEIFWASGAAMLVRSKTFFELGGFDPDFFAHMEEIDLCWRMKRAAYKVVYLSSSVVYHIGGGTLSHDSPQKTYLNFRNNLMMLLKNERATKLCWLLPVRLLLDGLAGAFFLVKGKPKQVLAIVKAHNHFFRAFGRFLKKRTTTDPMLQNRNGIYKKSIIFQFFILKKRRFTEM